MRTTILLSTLLFLAGSAPAQDSPITVGDSSPVPRPVPPQPPPIKAGSTGGSIYVGHPNLKRDSANKIYYVSETGHKAACFEMVGDSSKPLSLLGKRWEFTLNDGVVLRSTKFHQNDDPNRIEIDYGGKSPVTHPHSHEVVGDQLTSGKLEIKGGKTTQYPPGPKPPSLSFTIHYCQGGVCPDPNCK
jgi:hypothetical protein